MRNRQVHRNSISRKKYYLRFLFLFLALGYIVLQLVVVRNVINKRKSYSKNTNNSTSRVIRKNANNDTSRVVRENIHDATSRVIPKIVSESVPTIINPTISAFTCLEELEDAQNQSYIGKVRISSPKSSFWMTFEQKDNWIESLTRQILADRYKPGRVVIFERNTESSNSILLSLSSRSLGHDVLTVFSSSQEDEDLQKNTTNMLLCKSLALNHWIEDHSVSIYNIDIPKNNSTSFSLSQQLVQTFLAKGWLQEQIPIPIYLLYVSEPLVLKLINTPLEKDIKQIENIVIHISSWTTSEAELSNLIYNMWNDKYELFSVHSEELVNEEKSNVIEEAIRQLQNHINRSASVYLANHLINVTMSTPNMLLRWRKKNVFDPSTFQPTWNWFRYSSVVNKNISTTAATSNDTRKLLIAHYSGVGDAYEELLRVASVTSHAYAKKYNADFLQMQGVGLGGFTPAHSCYNKIEILRRVLSLKEKYDIILILDSDAIIFNLDLDFRDLIPPNMMLVAQRANVSDAPETYIINNGVTLWNLKHPMTDTVVTEWHRRSVSAIRQKNVIRGFYQVSDQDPLQALLKEYSSEERKEMLLSVTHQFAFHSATVVKHLIRDKMHDWTGNQNKVRLDKLKALQKNICSKYKPLCENV